MLVESPLEASVDKNKESPTEDLATKVDTYLPGPSSVIIPETKTTDNPVLSQDECEALIKEYFPQGKVHNYYTCFNKCSKVSEQELRRIQPTKFHHGWVEKIDRWWLRHVGGEECIA